MVSVGEEGGIRVGQIKASGKCVPGARMNYYGLVWRSVGENIRVL